MKEIRDLPRAIARPFCRTTYRRESSGHRREAAPSFRAYVSISIRFVHLLLLYTFFHLKKGNLFRQMQKPRRKRGFCALSNFS